MTKYINYKQTYYYKSYFKFYFILTTSLILNKPTNNQ